MDRLFRFQIDDSYIRFPLSRLDLVSDDRPAADDADDDRLIVETGVAAVLARLQDLSWFSFGHLFSLLGLGFQFFKSRFMDSAYTRVSGDSFGLPII